jgi:hypothetical protein
MSCLEQDYASRKLCRKHTALSSNKNVHQENCEEKVYGATRTLNVHTALIGVLCAVCFARDEALVWL